MSLDKMPFNWFDVLIVATLILGIRSGRKRGLSEELVIFLMWLAIVIGCAFIYQPAGKALAEASVFSLLFSYLAVYIGSAIVICFIFLAIRRGMGGKLIGSDIFGGSEFYLGMGAAMVRYACILIAALAILNARSYSQTEIKADLDYQNDVYGSNFFPSLYDIQAQVFEKSWSGPWIKEKLAFFLIKPTAPEDKQLHQKEFAEP
jgi:hypothetical protein